MNYFDKLPNISYNGYTVKNILSRARLSDKTRSNRVLFYPYTIKEDERPDHISNYYYDDPGYTWLIYMTNNIVDPYYDMPLNNDDLNALIIKKYGNIETAQRKVMYYRNNWSFSTDQISIDNFQSLPSYAAKYFDPIVDPNYNVRAYVRKRHDDVVSTNRLVQLTLDGSYNFTIGEEVQVSPTTYAFVVNTNGPDIIVQHTHGDIIVGNQITGQESLVQGLVTAVNTLSETIAFTEAVYWSPVSMFDYEMEQNEIKKQINLIDARYKSNVESELKRTLGS